MLKKKRYKLPLDVPIYRPVHIRHKRGRSHVSRHVGDAHILNVFVLVNSFLIFILVMKSCMKSNDNNLKENCIF